MEEWLAGVSNFRRRLGMGWASQLHFLTLKGVPMSTKGSVCPSHSRICNNPVFFFDRYLIMGLRFVHFIGLHGEQGAAKVASFAKHSRNGSEEKRVGALQSGRKS